MSNKYNKRNEFRYHNIRAKKNRENNKNKTKNGYRLENHPSYIFGEKGNKYYYHDLSHSNNIEGEVYVKLNKNPEPNKHDDSYINVKSNTDLKSNFGKRLKKWALDPIDRNKYSK